MTDSDFIPDETVLCWRCDDRSILNVGAVTNIDFIHISSHHGAVPDLQNLWILSKIHQ